MTIQKTETSRLENIDFDNLIFGKVMSDHMFAMDFRDGVWGEPHILPYGEMGMAPSLSALHYGQSVFEGMKVFYGVDLRVRVFRPHAHYDRLMRSCERMCIPQFEYEHFISAIHTLIKLDQAWIPKERGKSLYIRPVVFAIDYSLGLKPSLSYRFMVLTSPMGYYYPEGMKPVRLMTSGEYARAVRGGVGDVKTAGNYAASMLPFKDAHEKGFSQILWLNAYDNATIEEAGVMNVFFVLNGALITPALSGSILPGITRDSVLTLAREKGIEVEERTITIQEVFDAGRKGVLQEAFGTGTAAVIAPIGLIHHNGDEIVINNNEIGPMTDMFYNDITAFQYGEVEDMFGWCEIM
ncbi:MAG TPA: branched-chain amino acid aminotransferase [Patescibacteria group bacterium]|nr:branched-chain amino acid aminotransferase [Patescibacteria group bacterium]